MSHHPWSEARSVGGFTLIEVIGALVIFSVGVLMVMQVSGALGTQMRYSAVRSELAVVAAERLDSLQSLPLASLAPGTTTDTLTTQGLDYECTVVITSLTSALSRIDVALVALSGGGPTHSVTSYASQPW